ncbi:MAG: hypothetical protein PF518_14800 [Spirochaetaceae bacterium]|jgi:hypothetical protein|nr:hypothetical protein [Spirochaetaceae bacterium]
MKRIIIFFFLVFTFRLYSLEIWLNDNLYKNFTSESIQELSYYIPESQNMGIYLYELLPVMEEISSFRFISRNFILETNPDDSLYIAIKEDGFYLQSDKIGEVILPDSVNIQGIISSMEKLVIWFENEDSPLKKEIDLFGSLHDLQIDYRIVKELNSLLEYNIFNKIKIPDLIVYNQNKLNTLSPLLIELETRELMAANDYEAFTINERLMAIPVKMSLQVFLKGSSGGENNYLTSDFGNLQMFYPLLKRFGMEKSFDRENTALKDSLFYLTSLYRQGILKLSMDPDLDFIEGKADSIYTSSEILSKLGSEPIFSQDRFLPQMGRENPAPMLSYTVLSIPRDNKNRNLSMALIKYLTNFGVQQRINPESGFLPYNRDAYEILSKSPARDLLFENLENAIWITPGDMWDNFQFVLPKIYRLVLTGRMTIDDGIKEINNYLENPHP